MKNTIKLDSTKVYRLNVSIFKGRTGIANQPNLEPSVIRTQQSRKDRQAGSEILLAFC